MASIHLIDGEKGGVGKSWVARTMIQYLIDNKIPYTAVETDRSNPTVKNIYPDVETGFFSDNLNSDDSLGLIFDYAIKSKIVVANLPPRNHFALSNWIETKELFELGKKHDINFVKWWVCDGEKDSIELFIKSIEHYQGEIPHILIKNEGRCDDWEFFNSHEGLQKAITEYSVTVIDFPLLSDNKRVLINAKNLTFQAAANYEPFGLLGRNQITTYLRNAYSQFESTGLLLKPQPPDVKKS